MQFDKAECKMIDMIVVEAANKALKEHGYGATSGRHGRFTSDTFSMKLNVTKLGEEGKVVPAEALDFLACCTQYGLEEEDLGKTFVSTNTGRTMRVVGLMSHNRKYPIVADDTVTGKRFKFTADGVRTALALSKD